MLIFGWMLGRGNNSLLLSLYKYCLIIGCYHKTWRESKRSKYINNGRDRVSIEYNDIYVCMCAMHKYASMSLCTYKMNEIKVCSYMCMIFIHRSVFCNTIEKIQQIKSLNAQMVEKYTDLLE